MKKLTLGLAIIFSTVAVNSLAALPGGSKYGVCVPNFCGGFTFGVNGLYWRPSAPELDYALTYSSDFTHGRHHSVDPDYDWGFRLNIGYVFPCSGNDISLSWTHYDHNDSEHIRNPGLLFPALTSDFNPSSPFASVFPPFEIATLALPDFVVSGAVAGVPATGTLVIPILTLPFSASELTFAAAKADFKNDAVDLDFAQSVNVGCNLRLRWYGGLRYAKVETKLNATYEGLEAIPGSIESIVDVAGGTVVGAVDLFVGFDFLTSLREIVNQKSDYEGIGPRFGLDASYALGGGFGVVGGLSTSLLIGEIDNRLFVHLDDTTTATVTSVVATSVEGPVTDIVVTVAGAPLVPGTTFASTDSASLNYKHPDEIRIVPNIDAKIGLDYSYLFCNCAHSKLTIEAGWMVSHYFNAVDRLSQVGGVGPEFRSRQTLDASFDGPYIGLQFNV